LRQRQQGGPSSVEFDWSWALDREERYGDIVGFYHTHPAGTAAPSDRDMRTMRAWVGCLGKPLLCIIGADGSLAGYRFASDEDGGQPVAEVERFPRHVIVAVELHGRGCK
jgi:hypothetical protein